MSKTTTEMQMIEILKLVPYVNNARTHSAEQIMKLRSSLREFDFINPVIIDSDYNVIAGHGRIMAAKEEGLKEVPCVLLDYLTESQKKAYILSDNRNTSYPIRERGTKLLIFFSIYFTFFGTNFYNLRYNNRYIQFYTR